MNTTQHALPQAPSMHEEQLQYFEVLLQYQRELDLSLIYKIISESKFLPGSIVL